MIRKMVNEIEGFRFYASAFDTETGALVRVTDDLQDHVPRKPNYYSDNIFDAIVDIKFPDGGWGPHKDEFGMKQKELRKKYRSRVWGYGSGIFSPSPETVDISITDWCNYACPSCYQSSRTDRGHGKTGLVREVLKGFAVAPYQIAIGGGEPTSHPDFPTILREAREFGTIPNYTTAGHIVRKDVVEATNEVCGGVSVTYHAHKGLDAFIGNFRALRDVLKVQMNVHVIADETVVECLEGLHRAVADGRLPAGLSVILLAYHPDVGRASMQKLMPKRMVQVGLPNELKRCLDAGFKIAFSEGLLPFFLSRPEIGVDTRLATRAEGAFSCYVDSRGRMSASSFNPPYDPSSDSSLVALGKKEAFGRKRDAPPTVWEQKSQWLWERDVSPTRSSRDSSVCDVCAFRDRCSSPHYTHHLACAWSRIGDPSKVPMNDRTKNLLEATRLEELAFNKDAQVAQVGREFTDEEFEETIRKANKIREENRG